MTGTAVASKFATWSAPGYPVRIESSAQVLEEIRQTAVEGYHRVPHGGVETGGILFGTHQKSVVRIEAWRPIECEYTKGPSFVLSEKEEAALAETLKTWPGDEELARLEPVGWYRAHTRSEILLSDADLDFFNRFFPQPWQVGLIVRPGSFAATRAGFFFREPDGKIRTQSSYREFQLVPAAMPALARREVAEQPSGIADSPLPAAGMPEVTPEPETSPPPAATPVPEAEPVPEVPAVRETAPEPPTPAPALEPVPARMESHPIAISRPLPPVRPRGQNRRRKQFAVGLALLALAVLGYALLPANRGLALIATDFHGQLRISWDRAARPIIHATAGSIDIDDRGVHTQVSLSPADLRSGTIFYARQSSDVAVRLTVAVPGSAPIAESARFVMPGQAPEPAKTMVAVPPQPAVSQTQPRTEVQARTEVPARNEPSAVQTPTPLPAQPPHLQPAAAPPARTVVRFRAPQETQPKPSTDIAIAPPNIDNLQAASPAGLPSVLGTVQRPVAAPAAPRPSPNAAAASGRIIWTGKLARNGRLVLERNHASAGSIVGALPAGAARVSAYPGELTANGITVFTADPRFSKPATEKAGSENGWNPTTYTWEPKRAAGIRIVEQPAPQNGYKLVLECDIPKLSVVMLEWRATP